VAGVARRIAEAEAALATLDEAVARASGSLIERDSAILRCSMKFFRRRSDGAMEPAQNWPAAVHSPSPGSLRSPPSPRKRGEGFRASRHDRTNRLPLPACGERAGVRGWLVLRARAADGTYPPMNPVHVIGGGLAGSEAAWQVARAGAPVVLHEMRPVRATEAHVGAGVAELVCSNSFRSDDPERNTVGLLREAMRRCGSLILRAADAHNVPAGGALAVVVGWAERERSPSRCGGAGRWASLRSAHPTIATIAMVRVAVAPPSRGASGGP